MSLRRLTTPSSIKPLIRTRFSMTASNPNVATNTTTTMNATMTSTAEALW